MKFSITVNMILKYPIALEFGHCICINNLVALVLFERSRIIDKQLLRHEPSATVKSLGLNYYKHETRRKCFGFYAM